MIFQVLFGATALTVHETYEKVLNYTFPISVQSYGMMIPRPKELSRLYLFVAPFALDVSDMFYDVFPFLCHVWFLHFSCFIFRFAWGPLCIELNALMSPVQTWLCLTLTIALIGPIFYGVHFLSPYHEHHQIKKKGGLFNIQNCFWYMYGALLQQGASNTIKI